MHFHATDAWRAAYPGAVAGALLVEGVANPPEHPALPEYLRAVESEVRQQFAGAAPADLAAHPVLAAYRAYYRQFGKSYHVQGQLESVALRGKPLGSAGALVTAMFAAEIRHLLLTAGHDAAALAGDVTVNVAAGGESYLGLGERERTLQPGDMYMRDGAGIVSSVLYGPDHRTRMTGSTRRALFTVYAPAGVGEAAVRRHLEEIAAGARRIAPGAVAAAPMLQFAPARG